MDKQGQIPKSNTFARDNIRPSFLQNNSARSSTPTSSSSSTPTPTSTPQTALQSLRQVENSATSSTPHASSSASHLEHPTSHSHHSDYSHHSDHTSLSSSFYTSRGQAPSVSRSHRLLRRSSIAGLLTALIIGAFITITTNSMLGPQISQLFTEATDTQYITYNLRSRRLIQQALAGERTMPDFLRNRFEKQNIQVSNSGSGYELTYDNLKVTANNFDDVIDNNENFRDALSKAKRGRAANFFDQAAESIYNKLGQIRNLFVSFKQTGNNSTDTAAYDSTMSAHFDGGTDSSLNTAEDRPIDTDNDGEADSTERVKNGEDINSKTITGDDAEVKATNYLNGIAQKVAAAGGLGCAALKVGNMVSIAVAANELYQSINYFMNNTEPISKTMAENGNSAPLHQFLNAFNTPTTSTILDPDTNQELTVTGAPIEAEGPKYILGSEKVDQSKTKNYSLERLFKSTLTAIGTRQLSVQTCSAVQAAGAVISLATLAIPGGSFVRATVGVLLDTLLATGAQLAVTTVLSAMIPTIAHVMFTNIFDTTSGLPSGELFAKGASAANTRVARSSSGQAPSSASAALNFNQASNFVLAQDAAIDRLYHHPFDASSSHTFLGSILNKLFTISGPTKTFLSSLQSITNVTHQSLAALTSTYATGEDSSYMTTFGDCPLLEEIGAKGDIYCNPITSGDVSTINLAPDDSTYLSVLAPNLTKDAEGNDTIIPNSNLANYIVYCTERDSPFGVVDANISNAFNSSLGIVGDSIPYVSDVVELLNAAENLASLPWATGSICVNSSTNPRWDIEMKYYQRYIEDTRIQNQWGVFSQNHQSDPVLSFKTQYYTDHPLDTSAVGTLSRITGMTKSDTQDTIALLHYFQFLATYHPETRTPFTTTLAQFDFTPRTSLFITNAQPQPFYLLKSDYPLLLPPKYWSTTA